MQNARLSQQERTGNNKPKRGSAVKAGRRYPRSEDHTGTFGRPRPPLKEKRTIIKNAIAKNCKKRKKVVKCPRLKPYKKHKRNYRKTGKLV